MRLQSGLGYAMREGSVSCVDQLNTDDHNTNDDEKNDNADHDDNGNNAPALCGRCQMMMTTMTPDADDDDDSNNKLPLCGRCLSRMA